MQYKLNVVAKPADWSEVGFSEAQWKQAKALEKQQGPVECHYDTAVQNVRLSGGLYEIEEPQEVRDVQVEFKLEEKSNEELITMAAAFGKQIKKQMSRAALLEFVRGLIAKQAELITDD